MQDVPARVVAVRIKTDPPLRLDKALARDAPEAEALSRSRLGRLIAAGAVTRGDEVLTDPSAKVTEGELLAVRIPEARESRITSEAIPLEVVFEDDDLVIVNKPAGMVVHPAPGAPRGTLVNALLHHFSGRLSGIGGEKRPGVVHRIDKDTSGLLVVAKNDIAHHGLAGQFRVHTLERLYQAVCFGAPDAADARLKGLRGVSFGPDGAIKVVTHICRHRTDRRRQMVSFQAGRRAVTRVRIAQNFGNPAAASLVECRLETGRTHQIRVHMSYIGHGLIGDPIYAGRRKLSETAVGKAAHNAVSAFPRQALHAATLGFEHPVTGRMMRFEAPLPEDMRALLALLQGN